VGEIERERERERERDLMVAERTTILKNILLYKHQGCRRKAGVESRKVSSVSHLQHAFYNKVPYVSAGCVMLWIGWSNARKQNKVVELATGDEVQQANEILYLVFAIIWTIITVFPQRYVLNVLTCNENNKQNTCIIGSAFRCV
jgi:hypothetical protein